MFKQTAILLAISFLIFGCQSNKNVNFVSSPYSSGKTHSEPVFFNGKHYRVSFRFDAPQNAYATKVAGKGGRPLGGRDGDRKVIQEIGTSSVRHFGCARGQKGVVLPGTLKHHGTYWTMRIRCQ